MSKNKVFLLASLWFLGSLFASACNDALMRLLGESLPPLQVSWFRFLFGALSLLPFMLYYGKNTFQTSRPFVHIMRGTLLYIAVAAWCMGLSSPNVPFTLATTMSFTVPIFVLVLAFFILKEKVTFSRWIAAILGLAGIVISMDPLSTGLNASALIFIVAVICFASLDVINKIFVVKESIFAMLFYSSVVTTIIGFVPALGVWQDPSLYELTLLFMLGAGGNLILYFILKAIALVDISALAPLRYMELIFGAGFAFFIFEESIQHSILLGCTVIIPATLYLAYSESRRS